MQPRWETSYCIYNNNGVYWTEFSTEVACMSEKEKTVEIFAVPESESKKFRRGLVLFTVYILGYTLFTVAGTVNKAILQTRVLSMNLGIVGGMIIIASAIVIAVYYNWYATKVEAEAA